MNTRYFHSVVKERTSHNRIDFLKDNNGCLIVDKKQIASNIVDFYKGFLGSSANSLVGIDIQAVRDGTQLSCAQAFDLIRPVSSTEVEAALHAIDDDKSPGLDGFNSFFFKKAWHIVKFDILEAVNDFFCSDVFFPPVNITSITLVPKVSNACQVKDFRPISCCSVLYKIFAKILTSRLQKVMCDIVNLAQSGFIPGSQISDNVLLASSLIKGYTWAHVSPRCMLKIDMAKVC